MKPEPNSTLTTLSDDILLTIFQTLESDPRNWARLACVCTRFSLLIRTVLFPLKCSSSLPSVANDLIGSNATCTLDGWASLYKLAVCCPGLLHSGVLLEHSDFGLEREGGFYGVGTDEAHVGCSSSSALMVEDFGLEREVGPDGVGLEGHVGCSSSSALMVEGQGFEGNPERTPLLVSETDSSTWSLYDDLYFDTVYNASETLEIPEEPENRNISTNPGGQFTVNKRRKTRSPRSHLASGVWNLSREQGNKLLASRFRDDCLYICDWPGCIHIEEKRNYMLFRGVFKNFKKSRVWRTINDGNRSRINLNCAFCACNQTWDLHSAFCLRRVFGYHDDGEPVVRAYVCENGHVSGAWTDWPLYT